MIALATLAAAATVGHGGEAPAHGPAADGATVRMAFVAFAPKRIDVVAGDRVTWHNESVRTHTVRAADNAFSSGPVPSTRAYTRRFDHPGVVSYLCTRHPGMRGDVGVFAVLLDHVHGAGRPGTERRLTGRSSLPPGTQVPIESDTGTGFAPAGIAAVDADGGLHLDVAPRVPTTYRAAVPDAGPPVGVEVLDRRVTLGSVSRRARRLTVDARVTPASPGTPAVLQLRIPERFGWWPVARAQVDRHSRVRFRIALRRRLPARVVLTLPDMATVVATSRAVAAR